MSKKRTATWYVDFPTYQYCEDVKQVAKDNGLKIVDSAYRGAESQCDNPPKLTLCEEALSDASIDLLKARADSIGVKYGANIGYKTLLERVEAAGG